MNKVVTINLNGIAFQLEEQAYDHLRAYMDKAESALRHNPDRADILGDIEQSIADKCQNFLRPGKNVILDSELGEILKLMGPVADEGGTPTENDPKPTDEKTNQPGEEKAKGSADGSEATSEKESDAPASSRQSKKSKRLYKLPEGAMIGGVCNGLAAYLSIDVAFIRLAFVALAFFYGTAILVYIALMIILDEANTPERKTALHGDMDTAKDFVNRAKEGYYEDEDRWKRKAERRRAKREFKQRMRNWASNLEADIYDKVYHSMPKNATADGTSCCGEVAGEPRSHNAFVVLTLTLYRTLKALLTFSFVACLLIWIFLNVSQHTCHQREFTLMIVFLSLSFAFLCWPLRTLRNFFLDLSQSDFKGRHGFAHLLESIVSFGIFVLILVLVARYLPGVGHYFHLMVEAVRTCFGDLTSLRPEL